MSTFTVALGLLTNLLIWVFIYISFPLALRFIIIRRPIANRLVAFLVLVPIYIFFLSMRIANIEEQQRQISQKFGVQYSRKIPHDYFPPTLVICTFISFAILTGLKFKSKSSELVTNNYNNSDYCHDCGNRLQNRVNFCPSCGTRLTEHQNVEIHDARQNTTSTISEVEPKKIYKNGIRLDDVDDSVRRAVEQYLDKK